MELARRASKEGIPGLVLVAETEQKQSKDDEGENLVTANIGAI